jgi:arabinose-5-phosphate isomerase
LEGESPDTTPSTRDAAIETGRRVLATEGQALGLQARALDGAFADAVDLVLSVEGRVVTSGMGKSGHVARKIAATLASTGTPAQFVHPAEASHGDLGMVTPRDVALVLSNSGETRELRDIVAHTRRFSIPLIGVAARAESSLLRAADVALVLADAPEACAVGLAPTTSTTLTMALGDALAVAVMERRAFTADRFREFHPGGKLGAALIRVRDLMHVGEELPLVAEDAPMRAALDEISAKGFGIVGVVDASGALTGVITDGDVRRNIDGLLSRRAGEVATRSPKVVAADALAAEAVAIMNAPPKRALCLFVLRPEDGAPVGLLHIHDCLRAGIEDR